MKSTSILLTFLLFALWASAEAVTVATSETDDKNLGAFTAGFIHDSSFSLPRFAGSSTSSSLFSNLSSSMTPLSSFPPSTAAAISIVVTSSAPPKSAARAPFATTPHKVVTLTIFTTRIDTIISCPSAVPMCPARTQGTSFAVTSTVPLTSTSSAAFPTTTSRSTSSILSSSSVPPAPSNTSDSRSSSSSVQMIDKSSRLVPSIVFSLSSPSLSFFITTPLSPSSIQPTTIQPSSVITSTFSAPDLPSLSSASLTTTIFPSSTVSFTVSSTLPLSTSSSSPLSTTLSSLFSTRSSSPLFSTPSTSLFSTLSSPLFSSTPPSSRLSIPYPSYSQAQISPTLPQPSDTTYTLSPSSQATTFSSSGFGTQPLQMASTTSQSRISGAKSSSVSSSSTTSLTQSSTAESTNLLLTTLSKMPDIVTTSTLLLSSSTAISAIPLSSSSFGFRESSTVSISSFVPSLMPTVQPEGASPILSATPVSTISPDSAQPTIVTQVQTPDSQVSSPSLETQWSAEKSLIPGPTMQTILDLENTTPPSETISASSGSQSMPELVFEIPTTSSELLSRGNFSSTPETMTPDAETIPGSNPTYSSNIVIITSSTTSGLASISSAEVPSGLSGLLLPPFGSTTQTSVSFGPSSLSPLPSPQASSLATHSSQSIPTASTTTETQITSTPSHQSVAASQTNNYPSAISAASVPSARDHTSELPSSTNPASTERGILSSAGAIDILSYSQVITTVFTTLHIPITVMRVAEVNTPYPPRIYSTSTVTICPLCFEDQHRNNSQPDPLAGLRTPYYGPQGTGSDLLATTVATSIPQSATRTDLLEAIMLSEVTLADTSTYLRSTRSTDRATASVDLQASTPASVTSKSTDATLATTSPDFNSPSSTAMIVEVSGGQTAGACTPSRYVRGTYIAAALLAYLMQD